MGVDYKNKMKYLISEDYKRLMRALEELKNEGHYRGENYIQTENFIIEWKQSGVTKVWYVRLFRTDDYHQKTGLVKFGGGKKFETLKEGTIWMQERVRDFQNAHWIERGDSFRYDWTLEVEEVKKEWEIQKKKLNNKYAKLLEEARGRQF